MACFCTHQFCLVPGLIPKAMKATSHPYIVVLPSLPWALCCGEGVKSFPLIDTDNKPLFPGPPTQVPLCLDIMSASPSTSAISVEPGTYLMPQHVKQHTCTHSSITSEMHAHSQACTYTHMYTNTCTYRHIYTHTYMRMYTLMYKGHTKDQHDPTPTIWPGPFWPKA